VRTKAPPCLIPMPTLQVPDRSSLSISIMKTLLQGILA